MFRRTASLCLRFALCFMTQRNATFLEVAHPGGGLWPPNSNSAEICVQCTYPQVSSSCVYSFGSYRVDTQTNKPTNPPTNRHRRKHPTFFATLWRWVINQSINQSIKTDLYSAVSCTRVKSYSQVVTIGGSWSLYCYTTIHLVPIQWKTMSDVVL